VSSFLKFLILSEDIDFKVAETAPFFVASNIQLENFSFEFEITPSPVVIIAASLDLTVGVQVRNTLTFDISSKFQPDQIEFKGNMIGQVKRIENILVIFSGKIALVLIGCQYQTLL
jgi:hypothetical protein